MVVWARDRAGASGRRDDAFDQSRRHDSRWPHGELDADDLAALEEVAGEIVEALDFGIENQGFDDALGAVTALPVAGK